MYNQKPKEIHMHSGIMSFSESTIVNGNRATLTKPYLEISKKEGCVTLDFEMNEHSSILIYCKRAGEKEFTLLTETSKSPFIDLRPNLTKYAEMREYKAIFSANGKEVGDADFLEIKTKGKFKFW